MKEQAIKALAPFVLAKRQCCYFDDFAHAEAQSALAGEKERRS
jgi:hypothetical protein